MQIYEYVSCYFVGFALSLLALYISGIKRKAAFYLFSVNAVFGFCASLAFIASGTADSLLLTVGGFSGIAGQAALCLIRIVIGGAV